MNPIVILIAGIVGVAIGAYVGAILFKSGVGPAAQSSAGVADAELEKLRAAAEAEVAALRKAAESESRALAVKLKSQAENELAQRKEELAAKESALQVKLRDVERQKKEAEKRENELKQKEKSVEGQRKQAETAVSKAEAAQEEAKKRLETVAQMTAVEAKLALQNEVRNEAQAGVADEIKRIETEAAKEAHARSRSIIAAAIQRYAHDFVHERTVSVIALPSDDLKGRLIGREGRNIRALEAATGIDVIIDDTSDTITISCFNPMRREIARIAIANLVSDGRIHPTRIEEAVKKAEKEVDKAAKTAGEQAVFDLGLHRVHPELVRILGGLKFRSNYAQNLLLHSVEVGYLAGLIAEELGVSVKLARRAGLLHDIGRGVDHEQEGNHAVVGAELARKFGESPRVAQAIKNHHADDNLRDLSILDHVVAAANSLSAQRPGARRELLASAIKRLEDLEKICTTYPGVERAYALQAGREVRVLVENSKIDDAGASLLAKDIAKSIESQSAYPGSIRVVVVRETRASDYAR